MADIPASTWSQTDASNTTASPDGAPENMAPSGVNDTIRMMMGAVKRWFAWSIPATTAGTTTAYTLTYSVAPAALVDGMTHLVLFNATNGSSATLNVNSLGAKALHTYQNGAWAAAVAGTLTANMVCKVAYNSGGNSYRVLDSGVGAAFLAVANTFTGNNTFSGTNTFSGAANVSGTFSLVGGSVIPPMGRLTLSSGAAVMTGAVTGATSIYYTPHSGNMVPLYNGTDFIPTVFAELTNTTTDSTKNPAAATTNSNYDLFVWNDSGTMRLSRGPLWTSDTARGTGAGTTELERIKGIWTNKVAISNGPAANRGTYVGTIRTDGSSQANWNPGGSAAGGTAALLNVWNAYNRVEVMGMVADSTDSWSYNTATIRPANNSSTMRVSFVVGLQEDYFGASYAVSFNNTNVNGGGIAGVGYDSTTVFSGRTGYFANSSAAGNASPQVIGSAVAQPLGFHYFQALEYGNATGTQTWYGDNAGALVLGGFEYKGRC